MQMQQKLGWGVSHQELYIRALCGVKDSNEKESGLCDKELWFKYFNVVYSYRVLCTFPYWKFLSFTL